MTLPDPHRRFLDDFLPKTRQDHRIVGVGAAGSIANGEPDAYSDIDLVVVVEDGAFDEVMSSRADLLSGWARVLAGFTGEHVGEPRVMISLVGPPLLHVDVKFVRLSDAGARLDEVIVLWERDGRLSRVLNTAEPVPLRLDLQWIEDRFWVWVHYGATKIERGELLEAVGFLGFLRETVFGPMASHLEGIPIQGVRKLERRAPARARRLHRTVGDLTRSEALSALTASVDIYRQWRDETGIPLTRRSEAEKAAVEYLAQVGVTAVRS